MRRETAIWSAVLLGLVVCWGGQSGSAQESNSGSKTKELLQSIKTEPGNPLSAYHLDFAISEVEAGKKVNSRQYSMNLSVGQANELDISTRVPIETNKNGNIQYLDVGTNIWCRLAERGGMLELDTHANVSNFAAADQENSSHPIMRRFKIEGSTLAVLGKPMIMGSVDDPNSKRQFQLEVTVTKLR